MIMLSGSIPPKDACFQCYHPPVFPVVSAVIGRAVLHAHPTLTQLAKTLQFVCCFYGILTVGICYLILRKFPLSDFARLLSFGTVCFLPRHIYMSAMHSNDTMSYMFVALSVYLAIIVFERGFSVFGLAGLSVVLTAAIFTKYTDFVVLPMVVAAFATVWRNRLIASRKKVLISMAAMLLLPVSFLTVDMVGNMRHYHSPLPWNVAMFDPTLHRPRDEGGISYLSFKPWEHVGSPLLVPGKMHSFWTLIYCGMWFDTEPYFPQFLDRNTDWWKHYWAWYRGEEVYPGDNPSPSRLMAVTGSGLITLGLVPLALVLAGFYYCVRGRWSALMEATPTLRAAMNMFPVLAVFNAAGVIALTLRLPVYCSMKASYFLDSMPAFMVFLGLGLMLCEKNEVLKRGVLWAFGGLFALASLHVVHLAMAIPPRSG
jgi:4-amino-4-deoxy-L-arabinose transferase-like glycosyltransferase